MLLSVMGFPPHHCSPQKEPKRPRPPPVGASSFLAYDLERMSSGLRSSADQLDKSL